jgi:transcription elongation factor Elf1
MALNIDVDRDTDAPRCPICNGRPAITTINIDDKPSISYVACQDCGLAANYDLWVVLSTSRERGGLI